MSARLAHAAADAVGRGLARRLLGVNSREKSMRERIPLLVLGVGNPLRRDDGLGNAAIALLARRWRAPEGVRIVDGGHPASSLLPWFERADALVLVDAVDLDQPPGTLVRIEGAGEVLYTEADRLGLEHAADTRLPGRLVLLGIVPENVGPGLRRSRCVEGAMPALVDLIVAEASDLGFRFAPAAHRVSVRALPQPVR